MHRALFPLLILLSLCLTLSCSGTGDRCRQPLGDYCLGPCETYDAAVAQLRDEIATVCVSASTGTCNNRRFVRLDRGPTSYTKFFDTNGRLVGVTLAATSAAFCNGNFYQQEYGDPPLCTILIMTEDLCATPDGGTDGL